MATITSQPINCLVRFIEEDLKEIDKLSREYMAAGLDWKTIRRKMEMTGKEVKGHGTTDSCSSD